MTTDDTVDDAGFDAFLARRDDLSGELRKVGQPVLPAALRDNVMADIEAELARGTATPAAANDSAIPEGGVRPSWMRRWRVPAAFAASVLVGVLAHLAWKQDASPDVVAQLERIRTETAVEESGVREEVSQPAQPADAVAAAARPAADEKTKELSAEKKKSAAQPALPVPSVAAIAAPPRDEGPKKPKAPPVTIAQAETQTVTVTGIRASLQQSLSVKRRTENNVEVIVAEDVGKMPDKNVADSLQRMPGVSLPSTGDPALDIKRRADTNVEVVIGAGGWAAAEPAPRDAPAAVAQAPAPEAPPQPVPMTESERAKAWLEVITKKIDAGREREALDEWEKFRKAYPAYAVPDSLLEKVKAIKKD